MGLFSGLEKMGLGNLAGTKVFEEKKEEVKKADEKKTEKVEIHEEDFLYEKSYRCPICDQDIKSKTVRAGKVKLLSVDSDLRPRYQEMDCIKYDCVVCNKCGFASLARYMTTGLTSLQRKNILDKITPGFKGIEYENDFFTYEDAFARYQLVLVNSIVRGAKNSERAYICLKLSWLMRGMMDSLDINDPEYQEKKAELEEQENQYVANAYEGFSKALSEERFPIAGMDEPTFLYLVAELARKCKDYAVSARLVTEVITHRSANTKIKERARDLKEVLRQEAKK